MGFIHGVCAHQTMDPLVHLIMLGGIFRRGLMGVNPHDLTNEKCKNITECNYCYHIRPQVFNHV